MLLHPVRDEESVKSCRARYQSRVAVTRPAKSALGGATPVQLSYAARVDPNLLTALISAGAALIGAIVGAGGTIITARGQHRRTIEFERQKEERARESEAAKSCRAKIERMASLTVHEQTYRDPVANSWEQRANELQRLDEEVEALALLLPPPARDRMELAREALQDANDIVNYGFYYGSVGSVARIVTAHATEVLIAVISGAATPPLPKQVRYIAVAIRKLDSQRNEEYAEDILAQDERKRRWLTENPEAESTPDGPLVRLRRWAARAIEPG